MYNLAEQFRTAVKKHKDPRMSKEAAPDVGYPTGFLSFDFKNAKLIHVKSERIETSYYSFGLRDGSIVTIIGRSGCGKTTWAIQAAGNIVRPFPNATIFHDDIEGGTSEARIYHLTGMDTTNYIRRDSGITAENLYERIKMIHDFKLSNIDSLTYDTGYLDSNGEIVFKLIPTPYILDSLALLMPEKFTEEDEMSGQMSSTAAAKANSMLFKRLMPLLRSANIIFMVINHINEAINISAFDKKPAKVSYLKPGESLPKIA